jgi:hypothetical protein
VVGVSSVFWLVLLWGALRPDAGKAPARFATWFCLVQAAGVINSPCQFFPA